MSSAHPEREEDQPESLTLLSVGSDARRVDDETHSSAIAQSQVELRKCVRVYIDGFNLYHAIVALDDQKLKWLNFWRLAETFLRPGEKLDKVDLFTAVLTWHPEKQKRHVNFLRACRAVGVNVHEANFKKSKRTCNTFGRECKFFEEKQTDVSIAIQMVTDVIGGCCQRAILITADSDQLPTVKYIRDVLRVELTVVFPPGRKRLARELGDCASSSLELKAGRLRSCLLPRDVKDSAGKTVATMPALYA